MKLLAIVSGGLDSAVALADVLTKKYCDVTEVHTLSFYYGQMHERELKCAEYISNHYETKSHLVVDLKHTFKSVVTKGSLTGYEEPNLNWQEKGIPNTYVPGRNFIFLSYAIARAVSLDCDFITCGVHSTDAPYPDCKEYVLLQMVNAIYAGTPNNIRLLVPLIKMSKTEVVKRGLELHVPFEHTNTCYFPNVQGKACLECDACKVRLQAFTENETIDPLTELNDRDL